MPAGCPAPGLILGGMGSGRTTNGQAAPPTRRPPRTPGRPPLPHPRRPAADDGRGSEGLRPRHAGVAQAGAQDAGGDPGRVRRGPPLRSRHLAQPGAAQSGVLRHAAALPHGAGGRCPAGRDHAGPGPAPPLGPLPAGHPRPDHHPRARRSGPHGRGRRRVPGGAVRRPADGLGRDAVPRDAQRVRLGGQAEAGLAWHPVVPLPLRLPGLRRGAGGRAHGYRHHGRLHLPAMHRMVGAGGAGHPRRRARPAPGAAGRPALLVRAAQRRLRGPLGRRRSGSRSGT